MLVGHGNLSKVIQLTLSNAMLSRAQTEFHTCHSSRVSSSNATTKVTRSRSVSSGRVMRYIGLGPSCMHRGRCIGPSPSCMPRAHSRSTAIGMKKEMSALHRRTYLCRDPCGHAISTAAWASIKTVQNLREMCSEFGTGPSSSDPPAAVWESEMRLTLEASLRLYS